MPTHKKPRLHKEWIDDRAIQIIVSLQSAGHKTYLVGGCVRDLLAGFHPKDFDIATSARPEDVRNLVRNAYVIGRRFRLVLVKRDSEQYEVATFRRDPKPDEFTEEEKHKGDNVFGTPEEDAQRRDFTINALFYDPVDNDLIDYSEGMKDIDRRIIRMIGAPNTRLEEDPIRIFRALRLAHKLQFSIEPELRSSMTALSETIPGTALPRRREETLKILRLNDASLTFQESFDLGIMKYSWPTLQKVFNDPEKAHEFMCYMMRSHDIVQDKSNCSQLFALLLLAFIRTTIQTSPEKNIPHGSFADNPDLRDFMKTELGMFGTEMTEIAQALDLVSKLTDTETFSRKGYRRKAAFVNQMGFSMAVKFAEIDHFLSPDQLHFWRNQIIEHLPKETSRR